MGFWEPMWSIGWAVGYVSRYYYHTKDLKGVLADACCGCSAAVEEPENPVLPARRLV